MKTLKNNTNYPAGTINHPIFRSLDRLAIVVSDTEEALIIWRDRVGLTVLYSEEVDLGTIGLTHLDLGNTQRQLVQPLTPEHPIQAWLAKNGFGLRSTAGPSCRRSIRARRAIVPCFLARAPRTVCKSKFPKN